MRRTVYLVAIGAVIAIGGSVAVALVVMSSGLSREDAARLIQERHYGASHRGWRLPVQLPSVPGLAVDCGARTVTYRADPRVAAHGECLTLLEQLGVIKGCEMGSVGGPISSAPCAEAAAAPSGTAKGEVVRIRFDNETLQDDACAQLSSSGGPLANLKLPTSVFEGVTGLREEGDGAWVIEWTYHHNEEIIRSVAGTCGVQGDGPGPGARTARSRARLYDDGWRIEDTELSVR